MENLIGRYVEISSVHIINEIFNHYVNKNVFITQLYRLTEVNKKDLKRFCRRPHVKNRLVFMNDDYVKHIYSYSIKDKGTYFHDTNDFDEYFLNPNECIHWFFYISDDFYVVVELRRNNIYYHVLNLYANHFCHGRLTTMKCDLYLAQMESYYFQLLNEKCSFLQHPACVRVVQTLRKKIKDYEPIINSAIFLKKLSP